MSKNVLNSSQWTLPYVCKKNYRIFITLAIKLVWNFMRKWGWTCDEHWSQNRTKLKETFGYRGSESEQIWRRMYLGSSPRPGLTLSSGGQPQALKNSPNRLCTFSWHWWWWQHLARMLLLTKGMSWKMNGLGSSFFTLLLSFFNQHVIWCKKFKRFYWRFKHFLRYHLRFNTMWFFYHSLIS